MPSRSPQLESLRRLVRRFGGFRWRWSVLHGLALAVLALPGSLLVWFLLDWALKLPPWPLVILFVVAAVGGLVAALGSSASPPLFWTAFAVSGASFIWVNRVIVAALLGGFGLLTARALTKDPDSLATERNHPAWRGMYLLLLANQAAVAIVYALTR